MKKSTLALVMIALSVMLFSGCSVKSTADSMVYKNHQNSDKVYSKSIYKNISIQPVTKERNINFIGMKEFEDALTKSFINEGLYSQTGKYRLKSKLIRQEASGMANYSVVVHVQYTLTDSKDNSVLLNTTIIPEPYIATFNDAAIGWTRVQLGFEGAARKNIEYLLKELRNLK